MRYGPLATNRPNGQQKGRGYFVNGKKEGKWVYWHNSVQKTNKFKFWCKNEYKYEQLIRGKGKYINGKKSGKWKFYESYGKKTNDDQIIEDHGLDNIIDNKKDNNVYYGEQSISV